MKPGEGVALSGTHLFSKRQPKRTFIWFLANIDGSFTKNRTTLDTYRELSRTTPAGRPLAGSWAYEADGEEGVYPTGEEWTAIHGSDGCGRPCLKCDAAGYDAVTGKSKVSP